MQLCTCIQISFLIIATLFLFAPFISYICIGWGVRRYEILSNLSDNAVRNYLEIFHSMESNEEDDVLLRQRFEEFFYQCFGRKNYILPAICLLIISPFCLMFVVFSVSHWLGEEAVPFLQIPAVAVAAIVGAFMWICYDFIGRAQSGDFMPSNLFRACIRLLISAPLGLAITSILTEEIGIAVAFGLGAFPTHTLFKIIRRITAKKLSLENTNGKAIHELQELQGISQSEAERFKDEGISTILQLAYANPVFLTIHTNFSFSYVADCCSQALAWIYLEGSLKELRKYGLRGAQEIYHLVSEIDGNPDTPDGIANNNLTFIASELETNVDSLKYAMGQIAYDPYTLFLCDVWQAEISDNTGGSN